MNETHWHLLINHIPVLGLLFTLFLFAATFILRRKALYQVTLVWLIIVGLSVIPTYITGQNAHEVLHELSEVSFDAIDPHEYWATYVLYALLITAIIALIALTRLVKQKTVEDRLQSLVSPLITFLFTLIASSLTVYTAMLGGEIRHIEIHPLPDMETPMNDEEEMEEQPTHTPNNNTSESDHHTHNHHH